MAHPQEVKKAIKLLADHERAIGRLYKEYGKKFPDMPLWQKLFCEEEQHAGWFELFSNDEYEGKLLLTENYNKESIYQSIRRIENLINEAKNHNQKQALITAMALEDMLLEKNILKIFNEAEPAIHIVLIRLVQATRRHRNLIEKEFDRIALAGN